MKLELIEEYLTKATDIIIQYENNLLSEGNLFNIFSILNLSSKEVRLHSSFIAELINPKGTHGFQMKFLELFILELKKHIPVDKINTIDLKKIQTKSEKYIGQINKDKTRGGRIDIHLEDNRNNRIIIENKIFAGDEENQLLRYYNYDKNALLLYLTLNGDSANIWSTKGELIKDKDYFCLSYREFIVKWLRECILHSSNIPKVSETINQYLQILITFTQPQIDTPMSTEITKLISQNKDFYNSIDEIAASYHSFRQSIFDTFWKQLENKRPNDTTICKMQNGLECKYFIDEDGDGFYYGFYLSKNNEKCDMLAKEFDHIAEAFKKIDNFNRNRNYIAWIYSKLFKKFWDQDKEVIFELNNEYEMDKLTEQVVKDIDYYVCEIKKSICENASS